MNEPPLERKEEGVIDRRIAARRGRALDQQRVGRKLLATPIP